MRGFECKKESLFPTCKQGLRHEKFIIFKDSSLNTSSQWMTSLRFPAFRILWKSIYDHCHPKWEPNHTWRNTAIFTLIFMLSLRVCKGISIKLKIRSIFNLLPI